MFDRLTEVALVPFNKDELSILADRHYGTAKSEDCGMPIIADIHDSVAPYTDLYATLTHRHMVAYEPAEGGHGIWNDVEQKAWHVEGIVTEDDLIAIKEAIFSSLSDVRKNDRGETVGYSNEDDFGSFHMRFTIGRPYAYVPYFGYC